MSELEKTSLKNRLVDTGTLPPICQPSTSSHSQKRNYSPKHWPEFFESKEDVEVDGDVFTVYRRGKEGPVLLFLHGGGYSALSFAVLSVSLTNLVKCQCLALDIRGHGDTVTKNDKDLSIQVLAKDICCVLNNMFESDPPKIILVGHSMGGAIAVHAASLNEVPSLSGLVVIDVVEGTAMESLGSMQSFLNCRPKMFHTLTEAIEWSMKFGLVRNIESAKVSIPGHLKRVSLSQIDDPRSRRASLLPISSHLSTSDIIMEEDEERDLSNQGDVTTDEAQLKPSPIPPLLQSSKRHEERKDTLLLIPESVEKNYSEFNYKSCALPLRKKSPYELVKESKERTSSAVSDIFGDSEQNKIDSYVFTWRINLSETEPYWRGWFKGMNKLFLSTSVPKLLILAGMDRLDKELTIGQMQGKFHLQVLKQSGHSVHEDAPDKVAEILASFLVRNRLAEIPPNFQCRLPAC